MAVCGGSTPAGRYPLYLLLDTDMHLASRLVEMLTLSQYQIPDLLSTNKTANAFAFKRLAHNYSNSTLCANRSLRRETQY